MKRNNLLALITLSISTIMLSSCAVIGGIFKAGVWTGIILVAIVIAIFIFIFTRKSSGK
jgi:hypothetical protein